jgi:hypothetical protein
MTGKINNDPRCEQSNDCQARGGALCRHCHLRSLAIRNHADPEFAAKNRASARERMKALHADPEFAAKNRERMKALHADPEFRARCGFLTSEQLDQIAHEISDTDKSYIEIGLDWLISATHVANIAKQYGVQRRPRNREDRTSAP